jgi:5-formyltetrahydrofolate cyclo-ligase
LRREDRAARRAIPEAVRLAADRAILARIRSLPVWRSARHVALFIPFDGEPDLMPLLRSGGRRRFFVPVITRKAMSFAWLGPGVSLVRNFYGILEPEPKLLVDPRSLDLVLTPLVAFDRQGTRVGVGAGYYDRCFSFLLHRRTWRKPKLVGCAYALQQRDRLERNPWDVPLWAAVTERGFCAFP